MKKLFTFISALTLCAGLWAQNTPDTVRLSGNVLMINKVINSDTGEQVAWQYTMHEPSIDHVALRTTSASQKYGTFSFEDGTLSSSLFHIVYRGIGGMQQYYFTAGSMTIGEVGDSIVLDGRFLCEDDKFYILHFTRLISALDDDTDMDFVANFRYNFLNKDLDGGIISLQAYSMTHMFHLELYTDPTATEIPAGEYILSTTKAPGTALISSGIVDGQNTGCYASTIDSYTGLLKNLWFMTGGKVILSYDEYGRLNLHLDATNSYNRESHIDIAYTHITPLETFEIENADIFFKKDPEKKNSYLCTIEKKEERIVSVFVVRTNVLSGRLENYVTLPSGKFNGGNFGGESGLMDVMPFTVNADGKNMTFEIGILTSDSSLFLISGKGYMGALDQDSKSEYNGQYTIADAKLEQIEEGMVELTATNADDDDIALVFSATLQADGTLAAGEYTDILASTGVVGPGEVAPSVIIGADNDLWMIQSGKLTVATDGSMEFEGLNSNDKTVKATFLLTTGWEEMLTQPVVTKFFDGNRIIIRQFNKTFDVLGRELK